MSAGMETEVRPATGQSAGLDTEAGPRLGMGTKAQALKNARGLASNQPKIESKNFSKND